MFFEVLLFVKCGDDCCRVWPTLSIQTYVGGKQDWHVTPCQAKELSTLFTMDNVSNCVFGISSDCFKDPDAAFRRMADAQMKDTLQSWWRMLLVHLMPTVHSLVGLRWGSTTLFCMMIGCIINLLSSRLPSSFNTRLPYLSDYHQWEFG